METFLRATLVYFVLLVVFRLAGRRTLSHLTNFDFVLLLIIGEAVQNGLLGNDFSLMNAFLTVLTLICLDILLAHLKQKIPAIERAIDGLPYIIVDHGKLLKDRLQKSQMDENDVLEAAREKMGLERIEQVKYAVLEKTGEISIVPMDGRTKLRAHV